MDEIKRISSDIKNNKIVNLPERIKEKFKLKHGKRKKKQKNKRK